jgi:hypothetical protein
MTISGEEGECDVLQPSEAYQQEWGEKVGLGRCPHCPNPWCWLAPRGWVCQLPKAFTPPNTPVRTRAKKELELWPIEQEQTRIDDL